MSQHRYATRVWGLQHPHARKVHLVPKWQDEGQQAMCGVYGRMQDQLWYRITAMEVSPAPENACAKCLAVYTYESMQAAFTTA